MPKTAKNIQDLLDVLQIETLVGLDFETYFDTKYSLRSQKMSMSEYVRDPRFKAQCVGIRTHKDKRAKWYPHEQIPEILHKFDWSTSGLLAHNAAFDGFICSQHYQIVPKAYIDTLSMARPLFSHDIGASLDEVAKYLGFAGKVRGDALQETKGIRDLPTPLLRKLGRYCADDVNEMWKVLRAMLKLDFPAMELKVIDFTIRCFADPVCEIDIDLAKEELQKEQKKREETFKTVRRLLGAKTVQETQDILRKNELFADALRKAGVEPPKKPSPSNPDKQIYAFAKTDLDFQALKTYKKKVVRDLHQARLFAKSTIDETRAARMILRGTTGDCKLPIMLNYGRAHTLRWSGGDKFNPQNLRRGGTLRKCIKAPAGYRVGVSDSSQIEARSNAWLWDEEELLHAFATGQDVYAIFASKIYGFKVTKETHPAERFVGKTSILGLGYQMGAPKFQNTLAVGALGPPLFLDMETCERAVNTFRSTYTRIVAGWNFLNNMLAVMMIGQEHEYKGILLFYKDAIATVSGFSLMYPDLRGEYNPRRDSYDNFSYRGKENTKETKRIHIYGGKLDENIVQHLARVIIAEQAVKVSERYRIITTTHDEIVFLFHWRERTKAMNYVAEVMRTPPEWCETLPLDVEYGFDKVYSK